MKNKTKKAIDLAPHPKNTLELIGHEKVVKTLLDNYNGGKFHHALILSGQKGAGKATAAYAYAKWILSSEKTNDSLKVDARSPTSLRVNNGSHSDLLVIEASEDSLSGDIKVDEIRKIAAFLRVTASETKHRIIIIDSADNMNTNAANALLKLLEEPPAGTLFLLVSHVPGRLLPTIKSRCRQIKFQPLSAEQALKIITTAIDGLSQSEAERLAFLSSGLPGVAVSLCFNNGIEIYENIIRAINAIGSEKNIYIQNIVSLVSAKGDKESWGLLVHLIGLVVTNSIKILAGADILQYDQKKENKLIVDKSLEELLNIWEKVNIQLNSVDVFNLDKKATLISVFEELS